MLIVLLNIQFLSKTEIGQTNLNAVSVTRFYDYWK